MTDPAPIGELLVRLEALSGADESPARARAGWALVAAGAGQPNFPVLLDYALEHGFARACGAARGEPNPTWVNPVDGAEMVWVPGGRCVLGTDARPADLAGFSLARHSVTNRRFEAFLSATGYRPDDPGGAPNGRFLEHWPGGRVPPGAEDHPVVFVSLRDALAYCRWAGLAVPSEHQWEKAARGPDGRTFPWGDDRFAVPKLARVAARGTCAVGSYPATRTPYGCEDLIGNVSEWCQPNDPANPSVPSQSFVVPEMAVVRGSAFLRTDPRRMAAAHRRQLSPGRRNQWVGFRPAADLPCRPID